MTPIRVLIADDHPVFRFGMRALLATASEAELVGEAESGDDAIAQAATLQPDVILMDLSMPGTNGIEATRQILATHPTTAILIVTMLEENDALLAAMRAGARGYILKGADGAETLRAISAVANGEAIFSPTIAQKLIQHVAPPTQATPKQAHPFPDLTDRERDVLALIARGYTNATIAERLFISPKTVRNHVSNVFSKLQVTDRAQAVARARDAGVE